MSHPRRTRTAAVGLLSASLGLAFACVAATACSSGSGQAAYLTGSGGGPLGGPSSGGGDASTGSPTPTQPQSGGEGDDASSTAADAGATTGGEGGASDAASDAGRGGDGATPAITFTLLDTTITNIVQGSPVQGFDPIPAGATISLAAVGTALSIRANTTPTTVGSVEFILDANYTHTENATPYTLCGDNGQGTITACPQQLTAGQHTLTATEFTQANLGGTNEGTATVDFTITP